MENMGSQIYTQDWQEYEVESIKDTIKNKRMRIEYAPDVFLGIKWTKHDVYWIPEFIVEKESPACCLAKTISMIFPIEVLRIIKAFWIQMYYLPDVGKLSIRLNLRFMGFAQEPFDREVFVFGDIFFPRCRGYCIKCGEPCRKPPPFKIGQIIKYKLYPRQLQLMRLCYGCCQLGYNHTDEEGLTMPPLLKSKELQTYNYKCAYPKTISQMEFSSNFRLLS
jgi:hypothetical protein